MRKDIVCPNLKVSELVVSIVFSVVATAFFR